MLAALTISGAQAKVSLADYTGTTCNIAGTFTVTMTNGVVLDLDVVQTGNELFITGSGPDGFGGLRTCDGDGLIGGRALHFTLRCEDSTGFVTYGRQLAVVN